MEFAEAIHWDDGKGKKEKKEHGSGSAGIGDNDIVPSFVVG